MYQVGRYKLCDPKCPHDMHWPARQFQVIYLLLKPLFQGEKIVQGQWGPSQWALLGILTQPASCGKFCVIYLLIKTNPLTSLCCFLTSSSYFQSGSFRMPHEEFSYKIMGLCDILVFPQLIFSFFFSFKIGLLPSPNLEVGSLLSSLVSQECWLKPGSYLIVMENHLSGYQGMKIQRQVWKQQKGT